MSATVPSSIIGMLGKMDISTEGEYGVYLYTTRKRSSRPALHSLVALAGAAASVASAAASAALSDAEAGAGQDLDGQLEPRSVCLYLVGPRSTEELRRNQRCYRYRFIVGSDDPAAADVADEDEAAEDGDGSVAGLLRQIPGPWTGDNGKGLGRQLAGYRVEPVQGLPDTSTDPHGLCTRLYTYHGQAQDFTEQLDLAVAKFRLAGHDVEADALAGLGADHGAGPADEAGRRLWQRRILVRTGRILTLVQAAGTDHKIFPAQGWPVGSVIKSIQRILEQINDNAVTVTAH